MSEKVKLSFTGNNKGSNTAKCGICHKKRKLKALRTVGVGQGFALSVCKDTCYTKNLKSELIDYFKITEFYY